MFGFFSLLTFHNLSALAIALFVTFRSLVSISVILRVFKCLDKFEKEYLFLSTPSRQYFISKIQEKCLCEKHLYVMLRIFHNKWLPLTDCVLMTIHLYEKLVLWSVLVVLPMVIYQYNYWNFLIQYFQSNFECFSIIRIIISSHNLIIIWVLIFYVVIIWNPLHSYIYILCMASLVQESY